MPRLLAPLFLLISLITTPLAFAEEPKLQRTLSIAGHGEISAVPDIADISLGVASSSKKAGDALKANTTAMRALFAILKSMGIEDKDIATSNFSVNPRLDYGKEGNQPPKVVGYDVSNTVNVRLRKVDVLGELLDKAVGDGANQINSLSFSVSEANLKIDQARTEAFADAKRKADLYAKAGGFKLAEVITMSEGVGYAPPRPYLTRTLKADAAEAVPIAQGEQTLSVDVNVVWAIK